MAHTTAQIRRYRRRTSSIDEALRVAGEVARIIGLAFICWVGTIIVLL